MSAETYDSKWVADNEAQLTLTAWGAELTVVKADDGAIVVFVDGNFSKRPLRVRINEDLVYDSEDDDEDQER